MNVKSDLKIKQFSNYPFVDTRTTCRYHLYFWKCVFQCFNNLVDFFGFGFSRCKGQWFFKMLVLIQVISCLHSNFQQNRFRSYAVGCTLSQYTHTHTLRHAHTLLELIWVEPTAPPIKLLSGSASVSFRFSFNLFLNRSWTGSWTTNFK